MTDERTETYEGMTDAIRKVLDGFHEGVFVRSVAEDRDPAWAIRVFPYIKALGVLAAAVDWEEPRDD